MYFKSLKTLLTEPCSAQLSLFSSRFEVKCRSGKTCMLRENRCLFGACAPCWTSTAIFNQFLWFAWDSAPFSKNICWSSPLLAVRFSNTATGQMNSSTKENPFPQELASRGCVCFVIGYGTTNHPNRSKIDTSERPRICLTEFVHHSMKWKIAVCQETYPDRYPHRGNGSTKRYCWSSNSSRSPSLNFLFLNT